MKKMMYLAVAALAFAATSCNNEEEVATNDVQYVSELKINFGGGDARVAATHNSITGLTFAWEDKDEIEIYETNGNTRHLYVYDDASSSFKAQNDSYKMVVGNEYYAVRGKASTPITDTATPTVPMDVEAKGQGLPGIPMITDVFTATAEGTIATMHHLVGVIEIPVKKAESFSETVDQFSIYVSGSKIGNTFTAKPYSPYIISTDDGYSTTYSEEKTDYALSTTEATIVFIPALPGTYINPILNYYYSGGSGYKSITGTFTVERGKITKLSEVTFN